MKTKLIQKLLWLLALSLGLMSCKKNETHRPIDPYPPVTEGKVFLPVLLNKPDMDRVKKTEEGRGGKFEKITEIEISGMACSGFEFSYTDMDVTRVVYVIREEDKVLMQIWLENVDKEDASKIEALAKKNGFDDSHILAKRFSGLARESAEGLFYLTSYSDSEKNVLFIQYGKQPSDMPTFSMLPDRQDYLGEKYDKIKAFEEGRGSTLDLESKVNKGTHEGKVKSARFKINDISELPTDSYKGYFFDWDSDASTGKCYKIICIFKNPSLCYYLDNIRKHILPTKEFLNLCKEKGYKWEEYIKGQGDLFSNEETNIVLSARRLSFPDIYSGEECSCLYISKR